jgi:hypothetical protein
MPEPGPPSGDRRSLAGESSRHKVNWPDPSPVEVSDVAVDGDPWEPLREDSSSEVVKLAEPAMLEPGEMEAVGEESDPIEEASDRHFPA